MPSPQRYPSTGAVLWCPATARRSLVVLALVQLGGWLLARHKQDPPPSFALPFAGTPLLRHCCAMRTPELLSLVVDVFSDHGRMHRSTLFNARLYSIWPWLHRSGVCKKRSNGTCKYCHDVSKVAVCPAWLSGHCLADPCSLQHVHVPSLMPVCTFFLQVRAHQVMHAPNYHSLPTPVCQCPSWPLKPFMGANKIVFRP